MNKIRRFLPAFLVIPLAFLLSACHMDYTLRVADENTISDVVTFTMTAEEKQQLAMISMGEDLTCANLFSQMGSNSSGVHIDTLSSDDGGMGCQIVQQHKSQDLNLTRNGDTWTLVLNGSADLSQLEEAKREMSTYGATDFTVSIEMPNTITSVEPKIGTIEGNKVTFNIFTDDVSQKITITAGQGGGVASAGVAAGLLVAVIVVIGVVLLVVLSKKKKRTQQNLPGAFPQQGYPPVTPVGPQPGDPNSFGPWQQPQSPAPQQPWPTQPPMAGPYGAAEQPGQPWLTPQQNPPVPPTTAQPYAVPSPEGGEQITPQAPQPGSDSENPFSYPPQQ